MKRLLAAAVAALALLGACGEPAPTASPNGDATETGTEPQVPGASPYRPSPTERSLIAAIDQHLEPTLADIERARRTPGATAVDLRLLDGVTALVNGSFADAARLLADSDGPVASYFRGRVHLALDENSQAKFEFDATLEERPDWTAARYFRIAANGREGASTDDLRELQEALRRWPNQASVHAEFGRALERINDDPEAGIDWYRSAVDLGSTSRFVIERYGTLLVDRGEADEVRRRLEPLRATHPGRSDIALHLGRAHQRLGQIDDATREFRAAARLAPDDRDTVLLLATHLLNFGDVREGARFLETFASHPDPIFLAYRGHAQLELGNNARALQLFRTGCRRGNRSSCAESCLLGDASLCEAGMSPGSARRGQNAGSRSGGTGSQGGALTVAKHPMGAVLPGGHQSPYKKGKLYVVQGR